MDKDSRPIGIISNKFSDKLWIIFHSFSLYQMRKVLRGLRPQPIRQQAGRTSSSTLPQHIHSTCFHIMFKCFNTLSPTKTNGNSLSNMVLSFNYNKYDKTFHFPTYTFSPNFFHFLFYFPLFFGKDTTHMCMLNCWPIHN